MESLRNAAEGGLPIYAECGGAVYLGESLHFKGESYPLVGALPVEYGFQGKPRGHGYTTLETVGENPFFPVGRTLRGHEFHYTYMLPNMLPNMPSSGEGDLDFAFKVTRGYGFDGEHDGLCRWNILASYTHVHALGTKDWALALVKKAMEQKTRSSD
jgi:cobyrinic acid a,c-diamide synthase